MNQRIEFALKALQTGNFKALCQEYGISPKTGYKWKERFLEEGLVGMTERSRRPRSSPRSLEEEVVCEIIRLKNKHLHWGARKLKKVYERLHGAGPSESSYKRVLERCGLTQRRRLRIRQQSGRLSSGRRAQAPNQVWTVDFKGWWYGAEGQRCEPLTVRDEYSRYVLAVKALPDAKSATVQRCFEEMFEVYGLPEAMRSDNGPPFASPTGVLGLSRLSAWWVVLGIDLERGRPGHPEDNGGHERLHGDMSRELEGAEGGDRQAVWDEWRETFNHQRPHEALEMKCPAEFYHPSQRKYEGSPEDLSYEGMETRKVLQAGALCWQGQSIFLSGALRGWSVGLQPSSGGKWKVWFGRLLLGHLDPSTVSFERATGTSTHQEQ